MMPHSHPEDRIYTVISGIFYIGLGDNFDVDQLQAYPPGSIIILPGNTSHFHWAKSGEYITQVIAQHPGSFRHRAFLDAASKPAAHDVTATGPLGLEYIDANNDPRNQSS